MRRRKGIPAAQPAFVEADVESISRVEPAPAPAAPVTARRGSRRESDREAVLAANAMFYRAFEMRDVSLMGQLWANGPHVRCIHPGSEPLCGWDEVIGSWEMIFGGLESLRFELTDITVRVGGDLAWVEHSEMLQSEAEGKPAFGHVLATNLFERGSDGRWRMIHHHASPNVARSPRPDGTQLH